MGEASAPTNACHGSMNRSNGHGASMMMKEDEMMER